MIPESNAAGAVRDRVGKRSGVRPGQCGALRNRDRRRQVVVVDHLDVTTAPEVVPAEELPVATSRRRWRRRRAVGAAHDDRADHLGVERAEVLEGSGARERAAVGVPAHQQARVEATRSIGRGVWQRSGVRPHQCRSRRDLPGCRPEGIVDHLDSSRDRCDRCRSRGSGIRRWRRRRRRAACTGHDDRCDHLGVDRAEVLVRSGGRQCPTEGVTGHHEAGVESPGSVGCGVRCCPGVGPGDGRAFGHRQRGRGVAVVEDRHRSRSRRWRRWWGGSGRRGCRRRWRRRPTVCARDRDRPDHVRMECAEVLEGSRRVEGPRVGAAGVEDPRIERSGAVGDGVRAVVDVRPGDGRSGTHGHRGRPIDAIAHVDGNGSPRASATAGERRRGSPRGHDDRPEVAGVVLVAIVDVGVRAGEVEGHRERLSGIEVARVEPFRPRGRRHPVAFGVGVHPGDAGSRFDRDRGRIERAADGDRHRCAGEGGRRPGLSETRKNARTTSGVRPKRRAGMGAFDHRTLMGSCSRSPGF